VTLDDLLAECYRRCGYQPAPPAEIVTLFTGHLNDAQQELAGEPGLQSLLRGVTTFTSVAGQAEYGLPPTVARILSLRDLGNRRRLTQVSRDAYRRLAPSPDQFNGTADGYVMLGPMSVKAQPSSASEMFVGSSDAADIGTVHAEVVTTGGFVRTVTAIMNGLTDVSLGPLDIESVTDWYLETPAIGAASLRVGVPGGTVVGTIGIGTTRTSYRGIALLPTPSDARTYTVEHEREVTDLVTPQDSPVWLPTAFHRLLSCGARRRYWEDKREADRYAAAVADGNATLLRLKAIVNNPPDELMVPGGQPSERSNLGGMFPATSLLN
jgi:hypothetical protein